MPRRDDIEKILIIGSGPIVIGQAAEFDYSGVQACKVLLEEGYEVVLVNSNPATIMTDPEFATSTYVEPLTPESVAAVIEKERPHALLGTLGGQTALNLAKALYEDGTLERFGVELIGADYDAIRRAEDRELFRQTMTDAGLRVPRSAIVTSMADADRAIEELGLPLIVRPAFTLGGHGGGIARTRGEFHERVSEGLNASPIHQVLLEESVLGWGEFELEVMRDRNDNVVVVCSIENIDPMGVHTGDSVTVAPQQTLSDRQYQVLRDQALTVIRAVGVETGGSNIQFAVDPESGEVVVIEMNPRVSRSSALASKATGFPIAKIAARLAVGYALEEIPNDITRVTPASFEPTIDYAVVKMPRFAFEKFPDAEGGLTTQMKSVGEAMAIGRTFKQAFMKAMRSRELDAVVGAAGRTREQLLDPPGAALTRPLRAAVRGAAARHRRRGAGRAHVDQPLVPAPVRGAGRGGARRGARAPQAARLLGRPGRRLAGSSASAEGLRPDFKSVDTCAAEFEAETPYFYSSYERPSIGDRGAEVRRGLEAERRDPRLGAEPDRPGDRVRLLLRARGHDGARAGTRRGDGQLQPRDGLDRLRHLRPALLRAADGGGRARGGRGRAAGGGSGPVRRPDAAADRPQPRAGRRAAARHARRLDRPRGGPRALRRGAREAGHPAPSVWRRAFRPRRPSSRRKQVGFPLLVRPSYVLGGRAMEICYSDDDLEAYLERVVAGGGKSVREEMYPLLLDRFLENAIEIDVDALADGEDAYVAGIMQHVEEAGVHSGDSACVLPPLSIGERHAGGDPPPDERARARLGVVGLLNVQFALVDNDRLYVIEANPRASRTVPFVSKAIGVPLAKVACRLILGERLARPGAAAGGRGPRSRQRQGGGAAVPALPRLGCAARARR